MIKPVRTSETFPQPYTWQQMKHGRWTFDTIQTYLDEWCPKFFGYHLLKIGGLSCEFSTSHCQIKHQICLDVQSELLDIQADAFDLPFFEKSIDAVLLMHQLDYSPDPHRLLREVDRVLIDDGYLVLSGFNPISLFGLKQALPCPKKFRQKHHRPSFSRMYMPSRIHDWLSLLNYEIMVCEVSGLFPFFRQGLRLWVDQSCQCGAQTFGSEYFIVARKRTCPLKPIRPHWRLKPKFSPAPARCKDLPQETSHTKNIAN